MTTPSRSTEAEERVSPLVSNANAIRAVASAVEGTLGPKGLNCMLVDRFGEVVITNDGSTILEKIDATHPAAKMLVNVARAQAEQVGDGTTTATVLAHALISEGMDQINRGVPVTRVLEGMRLGISTAVDGIRRRAKPITGIDDDLLRHATLIAGRGHTDLADLCLAAADFIGRDRLLEPDFRLADWIVAKEGAENEVVHGVVLEKKPMNKQMPNALTNTTVLCLDDALEPDELDESALGTETGFATFMRYQQEFRASVQQLLSLGVQALFITKAVHEQAEEMLTDAGAMIIRRLTSRDMHRIAKHTGARLLKRVSLRKPPAELATYLGHAQQLVIDERLDQTRVIGGSGEAMATILVNAATAEVRAERYRVAEDAACALQAALRDGVVPGGGVAELAVLSDIENVRRKTGTMAAYGVDCVAHALRAPIAQILTNAGFNPLEKVESVLSAMARTSSETMGIDCDSGEVADMLALGIVDPVQVKTYAFRAAAEVAEAILSISTVIRKREEHAADEGTSGA